MLERYVKIRDAITTVEAVEDLTPRSHAHRRVTALVEKICELDSVCVKIQAETCTLAEVRLLFDACVEKYPIMGHHMLPTAEIVGSPSFESAIVKLQNDVPLSAEELRAVEGFKLPRATPRANAGRWTDVATSILRKAKKPRLSVRSAAEYDPLTTLAPPTSNTCERLFSKCKLVLTSLRSSTLPANFETVMFLHANRDMWNFSTLVGCPEE